MNQNFDPAYLRYPSRRYPVYAKNGMVCCPVPQAAEAGLEVLKKGGNAMDAAVASAAALTVTDPTMNGIGSDAFCLIWVEKEKKLYGLNSSGPAPMLASAEQIIKDGAAVDGRMPARGWKPVTVPGCVGAWAAVTERFGRLPMTETLKPAIRYAEDGYPAGAMLSLRWNGYYEEYKRTLKDEMFSEWFRTFEPEGGHLSAGDIVRLPYHAATLREIAETNGESFYRGAIAEKIDADSRAHGGYLRKEDLAAFHSEWVEPATVDYHGYTVCEIPPNGQGIVALMTLNILNNFTFPEKESEDTFHKQMEAMKLAFADGLHYITDRRYMRVDYHRLLDPSYGTSRAAEIGERAEVRTHGTPPDGGTVYFCTADGEGNMVSFIQSNYKNFGSGIVVKGTGIALQNRGCDFSLDPKHVNCLAPGKKTYHTIIPGFLMKDGEAVGPFGVMGAYMQPQGHVQVVMNYVDFHLNPQQCIDAPRWQWKKGNAFSVEAEFSPEIARQLARRGHEITVEHDPVSFGKGQMIVKLPNGVLCGGTEPRYDSLIACF